MSIEGVQSHLEDCHSYYRNNHGWTRGSDLVRLIQRHRQYHIMADESVYQQYPHLVRHDHGVIEWRMSEC